MLYTKDFKEKFFKHFKGRNYEQLIEQGSPWVGRYIEDTLYSYVQNFPHNKLVEAYESKNSELIDDLYLQSKTIMELTELNCECQRLKNNPEMGE